MVNKASAPKFVQSYLFLFTKKRFDFVHSQTFAMEVVLILVQSCKLYNNKYMIASTQIRNTERFAFIAILAFKLLSRKVLFISTKDNGNC